MTSPTPEPEAKMTQEDELAKRLNNIHPVDSGYAELGREASATITRLKFDLASAEKRNRDLVKVYDDEVKRLSDEHLKEVENWQAERNLARGDQEQAETSLASALEALKPFAVFVETNAGRLAKDGMQITAGSSIAHRQLTFGDCRRAAAELAKHKEKE